MTANLEERRWARRLATTAGLLRRGLASTGFRWWLSRAIGVGLIAAWWMGVRSVSESGNRFELLGVAVVSFGALVLGAIFLAPSLVSYVARPFLAFIDSVYLGGSAIERPRLDYSVAERLMKERRWEDAAIEFERIASWHRAEVRAYRDGIRAARLADDEAMANRLHRLGTTRCRKAAAELTEARRGLLIPAVLESLASGPPQENLR